MSLWPVAILVSFPIAEVIADVVLGGVDSVGAALAAGFIAGAIIGAAEWFGWPDAPRGWGPIAKRLQERGWRTIVPALRGSRRHALPVA
jgi:branched-subunit amino acid ABC-type transport system permease component